MNRTQKCKANGCDQTHSKHYCKLCEDKNSNHLARNCPDAITLYHGTPFDNIKSIIDNGLRASTGGCLGQGIYFAKGQEAKEVSIGKGDGKKMAIIKCKVNVDPKYCKTAQHSAWLGIKHEFQEWCLTDYTKYRIIGFGVIDGVVNGDISLPRGEIYYNSDTLCTGKENYGKKIVSEYDFLND
ncbi:interferon-inducible protein gig2 [Stylonychia lemnae]|uniref:Interferon-inducible protein gig2 n=1 Tax=Stylonychia lemnae TaxID=5949 RepID=A0A078AW75_STYLE|nr:interferon-inducible protein gig2 [Stylonychia lemnae]|eukprot:CDW86720.1 interferon-inducible protein gig2 [Stylonychia lemnae]